MQTRTAQCGHAYATPAGQAGRSRKLCDDCLASLPEGPERRATLRQRDRVVSPPHRADRIAKCGHPVSWHGGPPRTSCEDCAAPAPWRCSQCGALLVGRRRNTKFCNDECRHIHRGVKRAEPLPSRVCALDECDVVFTPWLETQRCCSEQHGKNLYNRESRADGRQKPQPWDDKRRDDCHRRRAVKKGASTGRPVIRDEVAERDGHVCGICGEAVDMGLSWPDPLSPSLDHVRPLRPNDGGEPGPHDPDNVQLAHLRCNIRKNNRTDEAAA